MAKVWKILALLLVITALVWLASLWRWQTSHVDPAAGDLLVQLGLLPVILTAALVASVWGVKHLRSYAASPAPLPTAASASPTGQPAPRSAAAQQPSSVRVLAASAQQRAGASWQGAQSAIAEGQCKAELDPTMKDDDGIAVFSAPMPDLSTDAVAADLDDILAALAKAEPAEWSGQVVPAEVPRALALLATAAAPMHEALEAQWPALQLPSSPPRSAAGTPVVLPTVAIRIGLPARWPQSAHKLATAWIERWLEPVLDAGFKAAGQSRTLACTRPAMQWHVHAVDNAEALWLLMDQQLLQWQREQQPGLLWVLAADSLISEDTVATMSAAGELFSGRRQQGRVPGEAAAALLLASPAWPTPKGAAPPSARLHRASIAKRDKSADASGRITPQVLQQAVGDALQGSGITAEQVQHITTDADHRASRSTEFYETRQALFPHIDTAEAALRLGVGCGDTGIAALMACTALAVDHLETSQAPALVLGVQSPFDRLAVLITPPMPPAAAPVAQAQAA